MKILTEAWEFFKANFKFLAVVIMLFILYLQGCFKRFEPQPAQVVVVSDTARTQVQQPLVVALPYQPNQSEVSHPIVLPPVAQGVVPASTVDSLIAQVKELNAKLEALGRQFYSVKQYSDSIQLKDTSGNRVGVVNLKQTVTENELKETQPSYQLSFPLERIVTKITEKAKPKNQVFASVGIQSPVPIMKFNQVEIGAQFKNKRDAMFGLYGTYQLSQAEAGIRVTYSKLIKLKPS